MNIGIIGAGFTGLSAAIELQKHGYSVSIFEKESYPGGLAVGFKAPGWNWSLEKHYHHIFTSDTFIQNIAQEVGVNFHFHRPNTSSLIDGEFFQLDSPLTLLQFPKLSIADRLRMGMVLGYLKYLANWKNLEHVTAHEWISKMVGEKGYKMIWEPLLTAKFGAYAHTISLAWFWARIKARSTQLGYPEKGFQYLADMMSKHVLDNKGVIHYSTTVQNIQSDRKKVKVLYNLEGDKDGIFDDVIVTLPNFFFDKLVPDLPGDYRKRLLSFEGIGAANMVLELSEPFLKDDIYWLNICEKNYPFLAVVEHTNFADKKNYDGNRIVYVGNYLPPTHRYYKMTNEELLAEYDPFLKKLNKNYRKHLLNYYVFKVPFAQPIVPVNFSKKIMPFETPVKHVYLSNMQQVYPWDRGTNYAVEWGQKVSKVIMASQQSSD